MRRTEAPLLTIAIPAFDRPTLVFRALASIAAQTAGVPVEVIVCDDGQLAATRSAAEAHGCTYIANPKRLGAVGNWNRCIAEAKGTYVMILHEDDALYPWHVESILPHLTPWTAAVCTRTTRGPEPPEAVRPRLRPGARIYRPGYFLKSSMTPFPGVVMRRDLALRLGGFDEAWGPVADYEFWYRLACAGPVKVVQVHAAYYHVGPGQWTEQTWPSMVRLTHLLRLRIAREQFPGRPNLARWTARFFSFRTARCYLGRFGDVGPGLRRCLRLGRIRGASAPAGWVWRALKFASGPEGRHFRCDPHAGRAAQIHQGRRGSDRVAA